MRRESQTTIRLLHQDSGTFPAGMSPGHSPTAGINRPAPPTALLDRITGGLTAGSSPPSAVVESLGLPARRAVSPIGTDCGVTRVLIFHLPSQLVLFDQIWSRQASEDGGGKEAPGDIVGLLKGFIQLAGLIHPDGHTRQISFEPPLKSSRFADAYVPRFRPAHQTSGQKTSLNHAFDIPMLKLVLERHLPSETVLAAFFSPMQALSSRVRHFAANAAREFARQFSGELRAMQPTFDYHVANPDDPRDHRGAILRFSPFSEIAGRLRDQHLLLVSPRLAKEAALASMRGGPRPSPSPTAADSGRAADALPTRLERIVSGVIAMQSVVGEEDSASLISERPPKSTGPNADRRHSNKRPPPPSAAPSSSDEDF